jgi:Ca2+/Na+ antiporter
VLELLEREAGVTSAEESEEEAGAEARELDPPQIYKRAALYMLVGAALAAAFADPMVDSIGNFSAASRVPPFFVAFVVTPFASNASELLSSIIFAKRRRKRNISLTFSQVYGAVTMNNTLYSTSPLLLFPFSHHFF